MEKGWRSSPKCAELGVPVLTDVHTEEEIAPVAAVVDVLQTPAFLCRQTDFIRAVARRQAGEHQEGPVSRAGRHEERGRQGARGERQDNIMVCERGASFGYNNLVSDMRSLAIMRETGCPVVFDATHSVQLPGRAGHRERRPARVRAGAGARGGRRRRGGGVHGNAPESGEGAVGRAECLAARLMERLARDLKDSLDACRQAAAASCEQTLSKCVPNQYSRTRKETP
jgi:hypothetical protein